MLDLIVGYSLALASTLSVVMIPIRLLRTRNSQGVSYLTSTLAFYSMTFWAGYTMALGDLPAYFSSLGPLICWALSLTGISLSKGVNKLLLSSLSIAIVSSALILVRLPIGLLEFLAVGGSLIWVLPQLNKVLKSSELKGISVLGYYAIFLENMGWILYAVLTGHFAYALAPLVQGPSALIIAIKARNSQRGAI